MAVAMAALDARVETISSDGQMREMPISDLHRLPDQTPHVETALDHGEMITAVTLPLPPAGRQLYRKVRDRASYAFALVSVAAIVETSGDRIRDARIAMGGVAPKPWRSMEAERALSGAMASDRAYTDAAEAALTGAAGYGDNDFKILVAKRTLRHTLAVAAERA
jgi:xanthine dehydrogenase YagS FAD-binding subunit